MIETSHVSLERAAEMLGTDTDMLLIAAAEGRIRLYGLLNRFLAATKYEGEEIEGGTWHSWPVAETHEHFGFVPLEKSACAEVLCRGETGAIRVLSEPDGEGRAWIVDGVGDTNGRPLSMERHRIFARREHIDTVCGSQAAPGPNTVADPPLPDSRPCTVTKVRNTALVVIAALAKQANINLKDRGVAKKISDMTVLLGAYVNEDTILNLIKGAPEAIEKRGK